MMESIETHLTPYSLPRQELRWRAVQRVLSEIALAASDKRDIIARAAHFLDMPVNLVHACSLHVLLSSAISVFKAVQVSSGAELPCSNDTVIELRRQMNKLQDKSKHPALVHRVVVDAVKLLGWHIRAGEVVDELGGVKLCCEQVRAITSSITAGLSAVSANIDKHYDLTMKRLTAMKKLNPLFKQVLSPDKVMHSRQLLWVHIYNTEELQKLKDQLEEFGEMSHSVLPAESLCL